MREKWDENRTKQRIGNQKLTDDGLPDVKIQDRKEG